VSDAEKTEQATERQVQKFRDDGRTANSKELTAALAAAAGFGALYGLLPVLADAVEGVGVLLHRHIPAAELTHAHAVWAITAISVAVAPPLLAVLTAPVAVALVEGLVVSGFNLSTKTLEPKPERLDVFSNFKSTFLSSTPWVGLAKGGLVGGTVAWAVWGGVSEHLDIFPLLARAPVEVQLDTGLEVIGAILQRALPAALAIGAVDFVYQRWKLGEDMMMSKQEVKEEHKDTDGDPHVKAKRRARARQLASGNSLRRVKEADVVVTNPTHYAVALRYRKDENAAPVVVARGTDEIALRIRVEAREHEVPIIENKPLARALYAKSKPGMPIPAEFYAPVAKVLGIVYARRNPPSAGRRRETDPQS